MTSVTNIGGNPQQPLSVSDAFIPDQLIAGDLKVVTDKGTLTGSVAAKRGTVLGRLQEGGATTSTGTAYASGTITIAAVPTNGDTLTIGGTVLTFSTPPGAYQELPFSGLTVYLQGTTALQAQSLLDALEASTDANLVKCNYSLSGSTITATSKTIGTGGNALTLATSDTGAFTLSGSTLASGAANTGNATIGSVSLGASAKAGNYVATCLTATTASAVDPNGVVLGTATFGTAFKDAQVNLTITAGGTPCAAGDMFVINVAGGAADTYKVATASATDGSQIPAAILVDDADATGGDVTIGVYVHGEFNANAVILDASLSPQAAKNALRPWGIYLKNVLSASDPS